MRTEPREHVVPRVRLPLVGRASELRIIDSALASSRRGRGRVVVVSGDAGTGKSRLLDSVAVRARKAGLRVATARGSAVGSDLPYDAAVQLLAPLAEDSADRALEDLIGAIRSRAGSADEPGLLHGMRLTLLRAARRQPLALLVDRAGLLDDASAALVDYLAHSIDDLAVLLVVAVRDDGGRAGELMARLLESPRSTRVHLGPLTPDAVGDFVRARGAPDADPSFVERCRELAAGYPDLLEELLEELRRRRLPVTIASLDDLAAAALPGALRSVATAMRTADRRERRMARAVLLLGDSAEPELVAGMLRAGVGELADIGERLAAAGVLGRDDATGAATLAVRSPLTERALSAVIPAKAMIETRRLAAGVLLESGAGAEAAARHLLETPPTGGADLLELMHEAGRNALSGGRPEDALRFLGRAVAEVADGEVPAELTFDRLTAEVLLGRPEAIHAHARAVAGLDDRDARVAAWERLGATLLAAADRDRAAEAFDRALKELERTREGSEARGRLRGRYATAALEIPGLADRARKRVFDQARDAAALKPPLGVRLAVERAMAGQPVRAALDLSHWSLEAGLLADESEEATEVKPLLVQVLACCDEYEQAEDLGRQLLASMDPAGPHAAAVQARLASVHLARGRVPDAAATARSALEAANGHALAVVPLAASVLAMAELEAGAADAAERAIGRAREAAAGSTGIHHLVEAAGWVALDAGDSRQALDLFLTARRLAAEAGIANPALTGCEHGAVSALVRLRRLPEAQDMAASLLERSRRFGTPRAVASALRVNARVAPFAEGCDLLAEALAVLRGSAADLERARCLTARGAVLRRLNRRNDARDSLRLALDLAHRLGASRLASRAHEELLAAGARPRRRVIAGCDSLTPAERRVAELAARRHTNREIADALFLTVKTVEWHLRNVFAKLGISSRRQIADVLHPASATGPAGAADARG